MSIDLRAIPNIRVVSTTVMVRLGVRGTKPGLDFLTGKIHRAEKVIKTKMTSFDLGLYFRMEKTRFSNSKVMVTFSGGTFSCPFFEGLPRSTMHRADVTHFFTGKVTFQAFRNI